MRKGTWKELTVRIAEEERKIKRRMARKRHSEGSKQGDEYKEKDVKSELVKKN